MCDESEGATRKLRERPTTAFKFDIADIGVKSSNRLKIGTAPFTALPHLAVRWQSSILVRKASIPGNQEIKRRLESAGTGGFGGGFPEGMVGMPAGHELDRHVRDDIPAFAHAPQRDFGPGRAIDAADALRIGLIQEIAGPGGMDAALQRLTSEALANGPAAMHEAKRMVWEVWGRPLDHAMMEETAKRFAKSRFGEEGRRGLEAATQGRQPGWAGRQA
jgi:hypothetical protein